MNADRIGDLIWKYLEARRRFEERVRTEPDLNTDAARIELDFAQSALEMEIGHLAREAHER